MVLLTCLSSCRHFLRQHRRSVRSVIPRLGYKSISSISLHAYTVCLVHVVMSWTSSGEPGAQELIKAMLLVLAVCCKGDSYSVRRLPPRPRPSRPCCAWPFVDATSASVRLKLTVYRSTKPVRYSVLGLCSADNCLLRWFKMLPRAHACESDSWRPQPK